MPFLALLIKVIWGNWLAFTLAVRSAELSIRLTAILGLAAVYVACVVSFTALIYPLIASLFSTGFGSFIGLAFPPIAGTVVAAVAAVWSCLVAKSYTTKMVKALVK